MKSRLHKETQYCSRKIRSVITGTAVCFASFVILVLFSKTANAGLVSLWDSFFGSEQAIAGVVYSPTSQNSQTIHILQARANINPVDNLASDTVPVYNGEALVPDLMISDDSFDTSNTQISTYIVREGDSISGVARMFKVSVNTILWANDLTSKSVLRPGQTLIILPVTGIKYIVEKNDTVQKIAGKFKADVDDIYNYNDITVSSKLSVGQTLIIPDAELPLSNKTTKEPVNGNNLPSYSGYYACPVLSAKLSQSLHGRNAIDLAAPVGTSIRASASGVAIISKSNGAWNGGYGNFVVISHGNGSQTLSAHMSKVTVSAGEQVKKGQIIGYIGMTGLTTGPHIHFEIRGAKNPFTSTSCK